MKKLDIFCLKHNKWGIRNLMLYISCAQLMVFILASVPGGTVNIVSFLFFDRALILKGQVWRLFSYILIPQDSNNILFLALTLYFYFWLGKTLELEWGALKFNIYYLLGVCMTTILNLIFDLSFASSFYLNMSMFFAYATLYPNNYVMLFFAIPVKIKYLAAVEAVYFLYGVLISPFPYSFLPIGAVLNYLIFFWSDFHWYYKSHKAYSNKSIEFKRKVREIKQERGYLHRCSVCGKTDAEYPELEFRYCSHCKDYACYCEEHILDHEHIH